MKPDLTVVPVHLRDAVEAWWERFVAAGAPPEMQRQVLAAGAARVCAVSDFAADASVRTAAKHDEAFFSRVSAAATAGEIAANVEAAVAGAADKEVLARALRGVRHREMLRIAWRDLGGFATLDETLAELSALADACIDTTLARLHAWHAARYGHVRDANGRPQSLVVLGFGKLGAGELNFSSDVDLVFVYPEKGTSDGVRVLDSDEYFARLGQRLIDVLDRNTADGFVFRVDMRLRPFGTSGPLAMSFSAMENYYQLHGRDWERYALIKARPVAGDRAAGERLLRALRPFVFRRYLDFTAFESLRDMKAMIAHEVAREGLENNIKLGRGGIREIEFIGQVFQLIRGGREAPLRQRAIRPVLAHLAAAGYLNDDEVVALDSAYEFLRRAENRLQMAADRQTHELPDEARGQLRLAWSMGFDDWPAFQTVLERHRTAVRTVFDAVFAVAEPAPAGGDAAAAAWHQADTDPAAALMALGFSADVVPVLRAFADAPTIQNLSARGRRRLDQL
ncbi:MAG TPA: bifunctional [glutamate--ammonia ligase]-adenylyl-L-tyrosine phosphorylase/[glutamate--ammonia-ligase] adenylyltransferase, partial [Gammaproteobacteria bacterium]|nr:bifunctional [glutamate--ammonia ligase]-adenylyl-L-tyrosine phosphorylase/[glutamate--ammonia-ligase] adenylyltransferase [Gammaproteobacteria bacterium]